MKRIWGLPLLALGVSGLYGCNCCHRGNTCAPARPVPAFAPANPAPCPPPPQTSIVPGNPPQQFAPPAPNPAMQFAPAAPNPGASFAPAVPQAVPQNPTPVFPDTRGYYSPPAASIQPQWRAPTDGRAQYATPENVSPTAPRESARLQPPVVPPEPSQPPAERPSPSTLPAGVPSFAIAKEQVAVGLKPILDGFDQLKERGYRTALHVRLPGEDDAADRREFESRGIRFLSLEVSPETLSTAIVQDFARTINDPANLPLFVYDKDGSLAGGLWYLYFRTSENLGHEAALARAKGLGWREDGSDAFVKMALAIQRLLAQPKS